MSAFPPEIDNTVGSTVSRRGVFGGDDDPAKYVIERRRFERPFLSIPGGDMFEWPGGIEGLQIAGNATLAEHKYIGDNAVVLQVMHRDDRRITLTGMFAGFTAAENVRDLLSIIEADTPQSGKILALPGIFPKNQLVVIENYNFDHPQDDRTSSFNYTITARRTGVTGLVRRQPIIKSPVNPISTNKPPKGKSSRVFVVRAGARTLKSVAQVVFKDNTRWREIYNKNIKQFNKLSTPLHELPTKPLPLGMKLYY